MQTDRPTTDDPTPATATDPADEWPPELLAAFDPLLLARDEATIFDAFRRSEAEDRREWFRLAARL